MKSFFLLLGDVVALYATLFLTLLLRYGGGFYEQLVDTHLFPFTVAFIAWIIVFYIAGLYDLRRLRNNLEFLKTLWLTLAVNAVLAALLFYLVPAFGIAPKTNLLIFVVIFAVIEILWRRAFNRVAGSGEAPNRALFVGDGGLANEIERTIGENPQLGYAIESNISAETAERDPASIERLALDLHVNLVVVPRHLKRNSALAASLYRIFGRGITVMDLASFYELVLRKIPLASLEETWFLENIESAARFYDPMKRALEIIFALAVGIVLLPFEILIAILIALTSKAVLIRQKRPGNTATNSSFSNSAAWWRSPPTARQKRQGRSGSRAKATRA